MRFIYSLVLLLSSFFYTGVVSAQGDPVDQSLEVTDLYARTIKVIDVDSGEIAASNPAPINVSAENAGQDLSTDSNHTVISVNDTANGVIISGDGEIIPADGSQAGDPADAGGSLPAVTSSSVIITGPGSGVAAPVTIDSMNLRTQYSRTYTPYNTINLLGRPSTYQLSDGSSWSSGAGSGSDYGAYFDRVEVDGNTVRYFLRPATDNLIFRQIDYNAGNHSAVGTLGVAGDLVLEAELGSQTAVLRGGAEIVENSPENAQPPRFNYFSAIVGSVVPFEQTYTLRSGSWQVDSFDRSFSYTRSLGFVDFANPISVPGLSGMEIRGTGIVPSETDVNFFAIARYDNGLETEVTANADWSVVSAEPNVSISQGTLSVGALQNDGAEATLSASWEEDGVEVSAQKVVTLRERNLVENQVGYWPTFQGNVGHTGHTPIIVETDLFALRWERQVGPGRALHQVAAGDGRVFVSVDSRFADDTHFFALDARDGFELWSRSFGRVNSVNPPALAYDTVYVQTGKGISSGPRYPLLHALDAATGEEIFTSITAAQWEEYYAPTVYDGNVYINGGTYGGMYSINAFSGSQNWFRGLAQYDEWTPAVDALNAYAYVGGSLSVIDRLTGETRYSMPDSNFRWRGWSMQLAPVLGGMDDVLVIHGGRLVRFDLNARARDWELSRQFVGQPVVMDGVVYAVAGNFIVAVNQLTGAEIWSLDLGEQLSGDLIMTNSHLFAASSQRTFAVELLSRRAVWSYPKGGELAIGNEMLYIAQRDGWLSAISMPEYIPSPPVGLDLIVPDELEEFSTTQLTASVRYADGRVRDRTSLSDWSVESAGEAEIDENGVLTIGEIFTPQTSIAVSASYTEDNGSLSNSSKITVRISVSVEDLIRRNIETARELRESALPALDEAHKRSVAAASVVRSIKEGRMEGPPSQQSAYQVSNELRQSIGSGRKSQLYLRQSINDLRDAEFELDKPAAEEQ